MSLNQTFRWGLLLCISFLGLQPTAHATRPYGADNNDISDYALGSYVWNVIFTETQGSSSVWTTSTINTHKQRIEQAASWWEQQARDRFLPGIDWLDIQVNFATPTVDDVAVLPKANNYVYFDDALRMVDPSITDTLWYTAAFEYNNNTRDAFDKNWAFTTFVSPFAGRAAAVLNGPLTEAYSGNGWHTYKHEVAHIFGALDEYREGTENHTGQIAGYLGAQNTNAAVHENGSTNRSSHPSLMNTINSTRFSNGALGAIGWWDRDNDKIPDILDTFPVIDNLVTSATDANSFLVSLLAAVNPLERTSVGTAAFGTSNNTVNTLASARYRVDGGSWVDLITDDGAWGGYEESLSFEITGLSAGDYLIDFELYNSVGNFTSQQIMLSAVPEPSAVLLALLGTAGMFYRLRL